MFGRDPILPEDVAFNLLPSKSYGTEEEYSIHCSKWLADAFAKVRTEQAAAAKKSRQVASKGARWTSYDVGDYVLYWQPKQTGHTRESKDEETTENTPEIANDAPGKWRLRWTGPHCVVARTSENTYDVRDGATDRVMEGLHVDTLCPYHPWDDANPSTSPDIDKLAPWKVGGKADIGALLAVPLDDDAFGIGRLVSRNNDHLQWQWYSNMRESWQPEGTSFRPGWLNAAGDPYWGERRGRDKPYVSAAGDKFVDYNIIIHGFELTAAARLPIPVRKAILRTRKQWPSSMGE